MFASLRALFLQEGAKSDAIEVVDLKTGVESVFYVQINMQIAFQFEMCPVYFGYICGSAHASPCLLSGSLICPLMLL